MIACGSSWSRAKKLRRGVVPNLAAGPSLRALSLPSKSCSVVGGDHWGTVTDERSTTRTHTHRERDKFTSSRIRESSTRTRKVSPLNVCSGSDEPCTVSIDRRSQSGRGNSATERPNGDLPLCARRPCRIANKGTFVQTHSHAVLAPLRSVPGSRGFSESTRREVEVKLER